MRCSYCGSNSHVVENCPKTFGGQINRANMRCDYCGSTNHNVKACPKTFEGNANRKWNENSIEKDFVEE